MATLDASTRERLEHYAEMVVASPHNLVSRSARSEILERHVMESVALASMLPAGSGRLIDVGSGGGFPGVVIAMVRPDLDVHLVESTAKKAAFLRGVSDELQLDLRVHHARAEELLRGPLNATFDLVTARAVAPLQRLVGWTIPFLRTGGLVYAVKGDRWREELADAMEALRRAGGSVVASPDELQSAHAWATVPTVVILGRAADPVRTDDDEDARHGP